MHVVTVLASALFLSSPIAAAAAPCTNTSFYTDTNLDGVNLPSQPASTTLSTPSQCAELCCAAAPACVAFTLNAGDPGARWCYLKASWTVRPNTGADSGIISGPRPPVPSPSPLPPAPPAGFLNAVTDCGADATGATDSTARLQACIDRSYARFVPRVPVFLPRGTYTVSDTLSLVQQWGGPDDGINVVPARFLPLMLIGEPMSSGSSGGVRPVLRLAPSSPGFGDAATYKPVVHIFSHDGEGVDMNNLFKGIDINLTLDGNPGAVGISHPGAQGATVTDVTVMAAADTFACFAGLNGAGGIHANIACYGGRYGLYIDDSQPVPVAVDATLVNQSISAILYAGQETLSLVGAVIVRPTNASGAAIFARSHGMTIVDSSITCAIDAVGAAAVAIDTSKSLYLRDVFVFGCATAVSTLTPAVPGPPAGFWLRLSELAVAVAETQWYQPAIYIRGVRAPAGTAVVDTEVVDAPPNDLQSRHMWEEATFPDRGAPGVADARVDCGAKGDGNSDDTAALQACIDTRGHVFLPPGLFRVSATLTLPPGGSIVGFGNGASYIVAASSGLPAATASMPAPLLRTSTDAGAGGSPTIIAHIGIVTWQHLPHVTTLEWRSQHPMSVWRVNFESRNCECLWLAAYETPTIPCSLPSNITHSKSTFSGLGRVYAFVNDDTGAILSTGASYRSLLIADTSTFATPTARLRFYSLNLEHAQSEANAEMRNASFVDVYSVKSEGNAPVMWLREDVANVSILGLGGGLTPFEYNFTQPSDFAQRSASVFRVDTGARGVKFAALLDHGYGASAPYWPPSSGDCVWEHHYPYPGEAVALYPFWTFPNVTMWWCWFGKSVATSYWWMLSDGEGASGLHTAPTDKPVFWSSPE